MSKPPIFIDRDGTILVEKHYLANTEEVELERGAAAGLKLLMAIGSPLLVVSNQSGIGRGLVTSVQVDAIHARLADLLAEHGVRISGWYFCPHLPQDNCTCRKPGTGLALAAAQDFGLDLAHSFVIGDKRSDVELASAIGGTGILVLTGYGGEHADWCLKHGHHVAFDLVEAAAKIREMISAR